MYLSDGTLDRRLRSSGIAPGLVAWTGLRPDRSMRSQGECSLCSRALQARGRIGSRPTGGRQAHGPPAFASPWGP